MNGTFTVNGVLNSDGILSTTPYGTGLTAVCYSLTGALSAADKDKSATINLSFIPSDTASYETVTGITLTVTVIDKMPLSGVTVTQSNGVYGTALADPAARTTATGGTWTYSYAGTDSNGSAYGPSSSKPTLPGSYTVTATYENSTHRGSGSAAFSIDRKALSYTGLSVTAKHYNNTTLASVWGTLTLVGAEPGDSVNTGTLRVDAANYADAKVGQNKTVTCSISGALSGTDAWKYTAPTQLLLKGDILAPAIPGVYKDDAKQAVITTIEDAYAGYSGAIKLVASSSDAVKNTLKNPLGVKTGDIQYTDVKVQDALGAPVAGSTTLLFPFPASTFGGGYTFKAAQMKSDGTVATLTRSPEPNGQGLLVTVNGDGPVAVSWVKQASSDTRIYYFTKGSGVDYKGNGAIEFRVNNTVKELSGVQVDGVPLRSGKDYTTTASTNAVTLTASYVKTLGKGSHTITALFADGFASAGFSISSKGVASAQTGDMGVALYGVMALMSASGAVWVTRRKKARDDVR